MSPGSLPIDALRPRFEAELPGRPVVLSSPTGSGKSTQVPRWCAAWGKVLVVEPRRVACRSLAQRVAQLESVRLGREVGYHVRDEHKATAATGILFATPGIVLRIFEDIERFDTVIVDEFHERGLEVDLLLALLVHRLRQGRFRGRLVIMSATLDGERLAEHVGGVHLHAEGRTYPVDVRHLADARTLLPDVDGLTERVRRAVRAADEKAGDMLVFLPGKGEIASCAKALSSFRELEILPLHGGLTLQEQSRIFEPGPKRRVILSTNVAETSLTVPGVGVVIDSGLVRQTRYVRDRGFLTLVPVALDSADQRSGRAGRTAPGLTFRLWSEAAQLEARTPPEIYRESLVPLLLAAAAQGENLSDLPFADPPKAHAVDTALAELQELGALGDGGRITERGHRLFGLPLDAAHGRLLVEAEERDRDEPGLLRDMVDLVAALSVDRVVVEAPSTDELEDEPSAACDAVASIRVMRGELRQRVRGPALQEAKAVQRRLAQAFEISDKESADDGTVDRARLIRCLLAADRRAAHIPRQRGRRTAWSNGGTEIELGRDCGAAKLESLDKTPEALLVLRTMALGFGKKDSKVIVTRAAPVTLRDLAEAGLGRPRAVEPALEDGRVVAVVERVYAKKVLRREHTVPTGEAARQAVAELFLSRRLFKSVLDESRENLDAASLASSLASSLQDLPFWLHDVPRHVPYPPPPFDEWVARRLAELGVESGDDVALLSADDLLFPPLPPFIREELDRQYPRRLKIQGVDYGIDYRLGSRKVILRVESGKPQTPPDRFYLPRFDGFRIQVEHKGVLRSIS